MILPSAKHYIISPVWRECRAKVERTPSNACHLLVCSCALPWLAYWCDRLYPILPLGDRQSIKLIADRLLKEKDLTIAPREMDSVMRQTYWPLAALTSSFFTQHCLLMSDYLTSLSE